MYALAHGRTAKHAADLEQGLRNMRPGFLANLCWCCKGKGEYEQRYVEGRFTGVCEYCAGGGLIYGEGKAAPVTVVNQVLNTVKGSIHIPHDGKPHISMHRRLRPERLR